MSISIRESGESPMVYIIKFFILINDFQTEFPCIFSEIYKSPLGFTFNLFQCVRRHYISSNIYTYLCGKTRTQFFSQVPSRHFLHLLLCWHQLNKSFDYLLA